MSAVLTRLTAALADRYRVERELGAGGMATVFLAHDLRHEREVAIKVLHPDLGAALGGERFLAEIKTTAKLQHPHILPLLDSGEADGLLFYVMPYVRGETLRARLERSRPLPIPEALRIAREVASALDYAHRQGVVHRDIKPENVLLHEGQALVADFGIALAVQSAGGQRMTQTGLSLGTPQYMAPEQAMGERTLDARADIYALGAVTYEMLAGEPPFSGNSVQAIVARVLSERPTPLATLRDTVPPGVEQAVATALAKLPADRFETARAFAEALGGGDGGGAVRPITGGVAAGAARRGTPSWMMAGGLALLTLVGGAAAGRRWAGTGGGDTTDRPTLSQFVIEMRPGERIPFINALPFNISPDGQTIMYRALAFGRPQALLRRSLGALDPQPVTGTDPGPSVTFSPDGRWIAYARDRVYKRPVDGEAETPLTPPGVSVGGRMVWLDDGDIAFVDESRPAVFTVPSNGGTPRERVRLPKGAQSDRAVAVPGRSALLFTLMPPDSSVARVAWADLTDGTWHLVDVPGATMPLGMTADAFVYVTDEGDVMAAPWDLRAMRAVGQPARLLTGVAVGGAGSAYAALSRRGDLLYLDQSMRSQLMAQAPGQSPKPVLPDTLDFRFPRLSPDGRRLVVGVFEGSPLRHNLYTVELAERTLTRLDDNDEVPWRDRPEWSRDGRHVYYRWVQGPTVGFARRPADRSTPEQRWTIPGTAVHEVTALADDRTLVGRLNGAPVGPQRIATWTLGDTASRPVPGTKVGDGAPRVSPDGSWILFAQSAFGRAHAMVTRFPGPGPQLQVDANGSAASVWGADGRTVYYPDMDGIMAATLSLGASPSVQSRRRVLGIPLPVTSVHASFDVGPDGTIYFVRPLREERLVLVRDLDVAIRSALAERK